jgi:hypothetical protein
MRERGLGDDRSPDIGVPYSFRPDKTLFPGTLTHPTMLDQLSANDFLPWLGKPCRATVGGIAFDLSLESVDKGKHPAPDGTIRTPFTVLLTGPMETSFQYGMFTLQPEGGPEYTDIYIERIAPPLGLDPSSAYYQIIFA